MLNWDEYGKDENQTPPMVSEPKTETANTVAEVKQPEPPQPAVECCWHLEELFKVMHMQNHFRINQVMS